MINKKFMLMAVFLVGLLAVSAVSANDLNATDEVIAEEIAVYDTNQVELASNDADEVLGMEPIPELQNLIDNSKNGDVIKLTKDYNVNFGYVAVNKSVTIDGNNHKIDAGNQNIFLNVLSESVTLKNIQFVNWGNHNDDDPVGYMGIFASDVTISNCKFINSSTNVKAIVDSTEPNFTLDSCKFIDCNSLNDGIVYSGGSNLKVTNTEFINNNAYLGSHTHATNSKYLNSYMAISDAGALYIKGDNAVVSNCNFMNNTGYMSGAIEVIGDNGYVKDCSFSNNKARHIQQYDCRVDYIGGKVKEYKYIYTAGAIKWDGNDGILENPIKVENNQGYKDFTFIGENCKIVESAKLEASDVTKYYGGSEKYTVTLTNKGVAIADANVKISIDGKAQTVKTNSKGQASVDLNLGVGNHDVVAEYENAKINSKVTVKSTITASDVTGTYSNSKATATFLDTAGKALASKQATFKIGTSSYPATTNSNGVASADIPLGVDTYTVTAVNPTTKEEKQFKLTISKASSTTSLTAVQNGKSVTLTATVSPSAATGKVTFEINGKTKEASLSNGKAIATFSDLSANTYPAKATYSGDNNLKSSSASASVKVDKVYSITNVGDTKGTYLNSKVSATFLDANGKALANTKVTFKAGGKSFGTTTNSNGVATASVDLGVGTYNVTVVNPATKEEKQFKLTIYQPAAKIIPQNLNAEYASGTFTFKLVDSGTNSPLSGKELSYTIYNSGGSVTTDKNGIATLDNSKLSVYKSQNGMLVLYNHLDVGKHAFSIKGDDSSISVAELNDYLTVSQATIDIKIGSYKEYSGSTKPVTIAVTNAKTGAPMEDIVLHLFMASSDAKDYYPQSDENGIAKIDVSGLMPGIYSLALSNNDTKNIKEKKVTGTITILDASSKLNPILSSESISFVYGNAKDLIINLNDEDGTPIPGKMVYLDISGYKYGYSAENYTDENGQIILNTKGIAPDEYGVDITSEGCKKIIVKMTVKKATPKITASKKTFKVNVKTKKYTITLKTNKNRVMKNKKVTLKVNGKTYKATTNSKGKATFKITKLTKKGKFNAVIKFAGNSYYKMVTKTIRITVKK